MLLALQRLIFQNSFSNATIFRLPKVVMLFLYDIICLSGIRFLTNGNTVVKHMTAIPNNRSGNS